MSFDGNVVISRKEDYGYSFRSCIDYAMCADSRCRYSISSRVWSIIVVYSFKVLPQPPSDKRKLAPHFCFFKPAGRSSANMLLNMDKKDYQVPKTELLEIEMKPVMVGGSGEGFGGGEG